MESYQTLLASITGGTGETRTMLDPATGAVVGEAPVHTVEDLDRAVAAAEEAQPAWAALGHEGRSAALLRAADAWNVPPRNSRGCFPVSRANR